MSFLFRPYYRGFYNLPKGSDSLFVINNLYTHKRVFFSRKRARWKYQKRGRVHARNIKRLSVIPYLYKNSFAGAYLIRYKGHVSKYVAYDKI